MDDQQIETDDTTADPNAEATDADLIAAALSVGGAASVDVEAEAAAAGKPAPEAPAAEGEPEEPKIAAILRAREKAFAERQEATDYAAQIRQQAQEEAAKVLSEARSKAAADYEAELTARRARFRETPTAALRELGFPTEDLVDSVAREGTSEWKAIRAMEARAVAAEARASEAIARTGDFEKFRQSYEQQQHETAVRAVEQQFLTVHAAPDATPYLHRRYEPDEILQKAHALASQWRAAKVPFDNGDVAAYLEHQARQRLAGVPAPPPQVSGSSGAPKVRANGSRTLSAGQGSERRASPKPIEEMTAAEERIALMEVAAEARRTGG